MSQKKKNYDNLNYKGLRRIRSILDPKYDYYEPIKTISVTNNALITNNALETSIFRKPTFSGVYTNFNTFLPTEYKRGLLHTLLCRTYNICSSYFQIHEDIIHLKSVWEKNSFPFFFIDKCIHKFLNKLLLNVYEILILLRRKK